MTDYTRSLSPEQRASLSESQEEILKELRTFGEYELARQIITKRIDTINLIYESSSALQHHYRDERLDPNVLNQFDNVAAAVLQAKEVKAK